MKNNIFNLFLLRSNIMKNILHVDRSNFFHKIIDRIGERVGAKVFPANSAEEAFRILDSERIDLIITALELEKESGERFIEYLNNSPFKDIPVIVVTGDDSETLRDRLFSLGVVDYVLKKDLNYDTFSSYLNNLYRNDEITNKLRRSKIAVLDDSKLSLRIIQKIFESNGVNNVDYFTDVEDLYASKEFYRLYIIDLMLKGTSGEEVIKNLRNRSVKSIIIAISSVDHYKTISHVLMIGADDYLIKPFDAGIFMARLMVNFRTLLLFEALERKRAKYQELAEIDSLTGVFTRQYIMQDLEDEMLGARHSGDTFVIAMIDIDHFKRVNDRYGHQMGDRVLRDVASVIKTSLRREDAVGRYGGEEFLVILSGVKLKEATKVLERMLRRVSELKYDEYPELRITFSAGAVEYKGESSDEMVKKADVLLYKAKSGGRNRIEIGS